MLATPMYIKTVARAIMLATQSARKPSRGHVCLDVIANVLARTARLAAVATRVQAVVGLSEQFINTGL